ncbi:hypothetical protein VNO77_02709 [Canavalia gladiata]|uniref:Uncharacterized protein n=1 Tax=Canavalia gladiata TaxID=3824 RepID=A0AAN9MTF3_CANGL
MMPERNRIIAREFETPSFPIRLDHRSREITFRSAAFSGSADGQTRIVGPLFQVQNAEHPLLSPTRRQDDRKQGSSNEKTSLAIRRRSGESLPPHHDARLRGIVKERKSTAGKKLGQLRRRSSGDAKHHGCWVGRERFRGA